MARAVPPILPVLFAGPGASAPEQVASPPAATGRWGGPWRSKAGSSWSSRVTSFWGRPGGSSAPGACLVVGLGTSSPLIERVAAGLAAVEQGITRTLSLPLGTSVLAVARPAPVSGG
jgi:hypothetical protein